MSQQSIDGLLLKEMIIAGANLLEQNREAIDALNVFPVPELIEKYAPGQGLEDVYLNVFGEGDGK